MSTLTSTESQMYDTMINIGYNACLDAMKKEMREILLKNVKKSIVATKDLNCLQYGFNLAKDKVNCPLYLYLHMFGNCSRCTFPSHPRCTKPETNFSISEIDFAKIFQCDASDLREMKGMNKMKIRMPMHVLYHHKDKKILLWLDISVVDKFDKKEREKKDYNRNVLKIWSARQETKKLNKSKREQEKTVKATTNANKRVVLSQEEREQRRRQRREEKIKREEEEKKNMKVEIRDGKLILQIFK